MMTSQINRGRFRGGSTFQKTNQQAVPKHQGNCNKMGKTEFMKSLF